MMRFYTILGLTLPAVSVSATAPQDISTHLFEYQADGGLGNVVDSSALWKRQRWENADGALLCSKDIPCSDDRYVKLKVPLGNRARLAKPYP